MEMVKIHLNIIIISLLYLVTLISRLFLEELLNPVRLFLKRTQRAQDRFLQMLMVRQGPGIEALGLGSAPNLFAWIEFRGVAGQIIQRQPLGVLASKVFDGSRSVPR